MSSSAKSCPNCGESQFLISDLCGSEMYLRLSLTNEPPSDVDKQIFTKEFLHKAQAESARLDARHERLRVMILGIENDQQRLKGMVDKCRGVISTLRYLPPEIMVEIFRRFSEDTANILDAWRLGHVCSRWRNIILNTPTLWTHVSLNNGNDFGINRRSLDVLKTVLGRSRNLPLTIAVHAEFDPTADSHDDSYYIAQNAINKGWLRELVSVSERWQHVSFMINRSLLEFLGNVRMRIPILETLSLHLPFNQIHDVDEADALATAFEVAPRLKLIRLTNLDFYPLKFPLSQMTQLYLSVSSALENSEENTPNFLPYLEMFLSDCPDLTQLRLTHAFSPFLRYVNELTVPILQHHSLRKLSISDERCLRVLELPCLEHLHVKSPAIYSVVGLVPACPPGMLVEICNFLIRSKCSLKTLRIMDLDDAAQLCTILQLTPELRELKLKYNQWSQRSKYDSQLEHLLMRLVFNDWGQLVPMLKSFLVRVESMSTYYMKRTIDFLDHNFCEFLESRHKRTERGVANLENVDILFRFDADIHTFWTLQTLDQLKRLKVDGLNIKVATQGGIPPITSDGELNLGYTVVRVPDLKRLYV